MRFVSFIVAVVTFLLFFSITRHIACRTQLISTFSIVAVDLQSGDIGIAVQSKFPNVRTVVPWAEVGVGAVATQSFANLSYGPRGLALMRQGASAEQALRILIESDSGKETRQLGIVDAKGNSASWTGSDCFDWAGGRTSMSEGGKGDIIVGKDFAAQGNILVGKETVNALAETFQSTKGSLADRLVAAIIAGGKAGGDRRGEQSAALLVKRKGAGYNSTSDDYIDISIYDHQKPLEELERLYRLHQLYFFRSDENNLIKIDSVLCKELQTILKDKEYKKQEFYSGPMNGVFDSATCQALQNFMGWENYDVRIRRDDRIDKEVLEDIRNNYKEWRKRNK